MVFLDHRRGLWKVLELLYELLVKLLSISFHHLNQLTWCQLTVSSICLLRQSMSWSFKTNVVYFGLTVWTLSNAKKYQAFAPRCFIFLIWNQFSLEVLCLKFFVSKFHGSKLDSLSTKLNWSKRGISKRSSFSAQNLLL